MPSQQYIHLLISSALDKAVLRAQLESAQQLASTASATRPAHVADVADTGMEACSLPVTPRRASNGSSYLPPGCGSPAMSLFNGYWPNDMDQLLDGRPSFVLDRLSAGACIGAYR